jgi:FkbM family methyltransferase
MDNKNNSASSILESLFLALPELHAHHKRSGNIYEFIKKAIRSQIEILFSPKEDKSVDFKPFGEIIFPYHKMGAIDSLNLFDLDELIIFSYYWLHRKRYFRAIDIGANIGLHSIILNKCGFEVQSYEPDPAHYGILKSNLKKNNCSKTTPLNFAISSKDEEMEFTRVLGNTTGSHLSGSKANPYGDLEKFPVKVKAIKSIIGWADLIKMDAEGHEKEILISTEKKDWQKTDAFVEVENSQNAKAIYEHFNTLKVHLFSQKNNWKKVENLDAMPTSYREGSLFITCKEDMLWE